VKRALLLLCLLLLLAPACSRAPQAPEWAAVAARAHADADERLDRGDRAGAREALLALVATAPEAARTGAGAGEVRRVLLQDTHFRLARLALEAGEPAEAARQAEAGLGLGRDGEESLFVANLLVVRGAAHEALGKASAAMEDYQRALRINETLLHEALPSP
jgi:hypothetical protein